MRWLCAYQLSSAERLQLLCLGAASSMAAGSWRARAAPAAFSAVGLCLAGLLHGRMRLCEICLRHTLMCTCHCQGSRLLRGSLFLQAGNLASVFWALHGCYQVIHTEAKSISGSRLAAPLQD